MLVIIGSASYAFDYAKWFFPCREFGLGGFPFSFLFFLTVTFRVFRIHGGIVRCSQIACNISTEVSYYIYKIFWGLTLCVKLVKCYWLRVISFGCRPQEIDNLVPISYPIIVQNIGDAFGFEKHFLGRDVMSIVSWIQNTFRYKPIESLINTYSFCWAWILVCIL